MSSTAWLTTQSTAVYDDIKMNSILYSSTNSYVNNTDWINKERKKSKMSKGNTCY